MDLNLVFILTIIIVSSVILLHFTLQSKDDSIKNPLQSKDDPIKNLDEPYLQDLWRGRGIINTSITLQQACPGFFGPGGGDCPKTATDCKGGVIDLADYRSINNVIANHNNGVSCFALAATLQNSRLAQVAFGPFPSGQGIDGPYVTGDMTIGIFLDLNIMQKYIGCLSLLDSGSLGRYGDQSVRVPQALDITSEKLTNDYQGVIDSCATSDNCGLFMAGCGGSQGKKPSGSQAGTGYNFVSESFDPPTYTDVSTGAQWIPKGWLYLDYANGTPGTIPFFDGSDQGIASFEETLIKTQNIVGPQSDAKERVPNTHCQQTVMFNTFAPPKKPILNPQASFENTCADYWSYQYQPVPIQPWNNGDGYRENEVDIFVPQIKDQAQPDPFKPNMNCVPDQGFVDAFRDAVVGVYATRYCAKDVQFTEDKSSDCCNFDISKSVALALAQKYNSSPSISHKINAWAWDVEDPIGVWKAPDDPTKGRLSITLIT